MNRLSGSLVLVTLGFAAIGLHCKGDVDVCTPFPPPTVTTGAACTSLGPLTLLHDLGNAEPGGGDTPARMTVDDSAIYFTAAAPGEVTPTLYRMPKTGGALQAIDDGVTAPISFDGPSLVYTRITAHPQSGGYASDYPNVVKLGDRCSSDALPNAGSISEVFLPTVDGAGGISWIGDETSLLHWNPSTNTTSQIAALPEDTIGFVGDADHLYWTEGNAGSAPTFTTTTTITTIPSAGGTPRTLATLPGELTIAAIDDDSLYLGSPPYFQPSPTPGGTPIGPVPGLTRVSKADGSITNTIDTPAAALGFVAHDTNVYWVGATTGDPSTGPTVQRAPKSGGPSETILTLGGANGTALSIAFDACNIYLNAAASSGYAIWGQGLSSSASADAVDASAPTEDASTPSDAGSCAQDAPAQESAHEGSRMRGER